MNPVDRLIVSLDGPDYIQNADVAGQLVNECGVSFFKLDEGALMDRYGLDLIDDIHNMSADLFLDLKIHTTADTTRRLARQAFELGARFLSVHGVPSVMEAARGECPSDGQLLAVWKLSDQIDPTVIHPSRFKLVDGLICPPGLAKTLRDERYERLIVCPGIRLPGQDAGSHVDPRHPRDVIEAGADYVVIGQPILIATDPVAMTKWIIATITGPAQTDSGTQP